MTDSPGPPALAGRPWSGNPVHEVNARQLTPLRLGNRFTGWHRAG